MAGRSVPEGIIALPRFWGITSSLNRTTVRINLSPPTKQVMTTQSTEPPLLRFIRALSADEREAFAHAVGTTVGYLNQLVGHPAPNPQLKLALAIEAESHRLSRQIKGLVPLSLQDLLVGRIKTKRVKDHTTGEVFTLLPNGEMARRRLDSQGRVVLINAQGKVIDVEETRPGPFTASDVLPLEDDDAA